MIRKSGVCIWPPLWTTTRRDASDKPRGEVGVLKQVLKHKFIDNFVFLWIEYESSRYMGVLVFDDLAFCHQIHTLLNTQIGVSIKEIGDIDLSYML